MSVRILLALGSLVLFLGACSEASEGAPSASGTGGSVEGGGPSSDGSAPGGNAGSSGLNADYPEGADATTDPGPGAILPDVAFEGLLRTGPAQTVDASSWEATSLGELRQGGERYGLIHTAKMWCPSCRAAADDLGARGDELVERGALVIELVLDGPSYDVAPTDDELRTWASSTGLTVHTLRLADESGREVFATREYAYVIDLQSMEVLWSLDGYGAKPSVSEQGMATLLEYLDD